MTEPKARWYVINVFSGMEDKVVRLIREKAEKKGLSDHFLELLVKKQDVTEIKGGVKKQKTQTFFPGYILANMVLSDSARNIVHSIDQVTGFLGGKETPSPLSNAEVERIKGSVDKTQEETQAEMTFVVGEHVHVINGPFKSLSGMVEAVSDKSRLKVSAMVFGRPTPIEVDCKDVERGS